MRLLRSEFESTLALAVASSRPSTALPARGRAAGATGSSSSTAWRPTSAPPSTSCRPGIACSGTCATGRRPCACPRSWERSRSRFAAGPRASGARCESSARRLRPSPAATRRRRWRRRGCRCPGPRSARPAPRPSRASSSPAGPRLGSCAVRRRSRRGRSASGVFARLDRQGRSLELLDADGEVARTVRPGDGTALVAALRPLDDELVWLVTALDEKGLAAGVRRTAGGPAARRVRGRRDRVLRLRSYRWLGDEPHSRLSRTSERAPLRARGRGRRVLLRLRAGGFALPQPARPRGCARRDRRGRRWRPGLGERWAAR